MRLSRCFSFLFSACWGAWAWGRQGKGREGKERREGEADGNKQDVKQDAGLPRSFCAV
jgi:hypothetical protein